MRILLVNSNRFHQPWPVIPFGLGCVAAAVEQAGHTVRVLDLCFSSHPAQDVAAAVKAFGPELAGVSIRNIDNGAGFNTQFLLEDVRGKVIEPLKQVFRGPIVIGGPSVGINGSEMLEFLDLDFAIRGDGEAAMVELLRRLQGQLPLDGMPGLVRRVNGLIVEDNAPMPVCDLDLLPMDKVYDHIDLEPYRRYDSSLQIQTKRGCALSCSYCTYNRIEGRRWRLRDPQRVADDIERLVRKTGINRLEFTDSTFNFPLEHCKAVLRAIEAKGLNLRLRTMGLNPGAVDEELVDLMSRTGFHDVDLGAESGCDATLRGLGKSFRKSDVLEAARLLREKGIAVAWYLLLGGPGETEETLRETFDTVNEAADPWDLVNIGVGLRIYNGAPIADQMLKRDPFCTTDGFFRPLAYEPAGLGIARLKAIVKREALRQPNYMMYDEDETTPLPLLRFGTWLLRTFVPSQPVWRLFILMRKTQNVTGISALKGALFAIRNWEVSKDANGATPEPMSRERIGSFMAGLSVLATVCLSHMHSPYWLLITLAIAANLVVTSLLNRCVFKTILTRMGVPGERDLGRIDAMARDGAMARDNAEGGMAEQCGFADAAVAGTDCTTDAREMPTTP
ncbi:MAG: hypothetical protein C0404_06825 [Verrucomicrobia bacterium]|nr:hypothetical protein [Verrucomicrobiota bacterium]